MPDREYLGADLDRLERMAKEKLPAVALQYSEAATRIEAAGSSTGAAFARSAEFGGGQGPAFGPWTQLKDVVYGFLNGTAENLQATADAVQAAVNAMALADTTSGQELQVLRDPEHRTTTDWTVNDWRN